MALHPSLLDLAEAAPRCESEASARGVLAESLELLRNALEHGEKEVALAAWFSRVVGDVIHSPALASTIRLTGAFGRGDGLPTIPVVYLGRDERVASLLDAVGLKHASSDDTLARRVDSGLPVGVGGELELLRDALDKRPPALRLIDGLPDRNVEVDVQSTLLAPIAAIARWAAPSPRPTPDRLAIAGERELLQLSEVEALTTAWETGLKIELGRWYDHVSDHPVVLADLTPFTRTAYGSATRTVSEVLSSLEAREYRS